MRVATRRKLIIFATLLMLIGMYILGRIDGVLAPARLSARMAPYKETIRKHADQQGLDWRLICAVIRQESGFNPRARSRVGAIGLMQLMPGTARELGVLNVYHPEQNISGGIRYLRQQHDRFPNSSPIHRSKLALASYNGGAGHVFDAQAIARYMGNDADRWESVRDALGKLTERHRHLHQEVWNTGRPRYGYFPGYRQTIEYVHRVIIYYNQLCQAER